jgi:hypothetical protein
MSKSTKKNTANPAPVKAPIVTDEEINSYDEELNKRIDSKQPEGGTPPEEVKTTEDETTGTENPNSQDDQETDQTSDEAAEDQLSDDALGVLADYVKAYPDNDVFHITSDGQVFLDRNKIDAVSHAKTLDGKLKSYTV